MKRDILTVSFLFLVIILLSIWFSGTSSYIPYSSSIFSQQAKFEGFSSRGSPLEYSSVTDNSALDGTVMKHAINTSAKTNCKSVSGYSGYGVFCDPSYTASDEIDIYSQAEGSLQQSGYGYYNSKGPLQLDNKMKQLLQTRGMNASGVSSVIGGAAA
jgi:hypothetical protein